MAKPLSRGMVAAPILLAAAACAVVNQSHRATPAVTADAAQPPNPHAHHGPSPSSNTDLMAKAATQAAGTDVARGVILQTAVVPAATGGWEPLQTGWPMVAVHASLLPNAKVLAWPREDHDDSRGNPLPPNQQSTQSIYLWDPQNPKVFTNFPLGGSDLFCSGHAFLADGRLAVVGGHLTDYVGSNRLNVFDYRTNAWSSGPNMAEGRWYPTATTLADGELLAISGTEDAVPTYVQQPEVFNGAAWRKLTTAPRLQQYYPWMFVQADGRVFAAGMDAATAWLDTTGTGRWTEGPGTTFGQQRLYGSAVMYDQGKILIAGGDTCNLFTTACPTASAEVIDLTSPNPQWRAVAPMHYKRRQLTLTLMADGKVLATGGQSGLNGFNTAVLYPEIWDPATEQWTVGPAMARPRVYHSTALLLPDGSVLTAGGGNSAYPGDVDQPNSQIYLPPYLYAGARPVITAAPGDVAYSQIFSVQTPDPASIAKVYWIRLGSTTHAFNESQRINYLPFSKTLGTVQVQAPANGNLAPPGFYLLFVMNTAGVPSVAATIQVHPNVSQTPPGNGVLATGQSLKIGQSLTANDGAGGSYTLVMQGDGNLVEYHGASVIWASETQNLGGVQALMQNDGNLVIYPAHGPAVWASGTGGRTPGAYALVLQGGDGNLVIYTGNGIPVWTRGTGPLPPPADVGSLNTGQVLGVNQQLLAHDGTGGVYTLVMQGDGNLVEYHGAAVVWASGTPNSGGVRVVMQSDGNLVIYPATGPAVWASGTSGRAGGAFSLALQGSDGNLVIYAASGVPIWTRGTGPLPLPADVATLNTGQVLNVNQQLVAHDGKGGVYTLVMQGDGNLVEYHGAGVVWASRTQTLGGIRLVMQGDGNLVIYPAAGAAVWASGTGGRSPGAYTLALQGGDGNLVIYAANGTPIWDWESGRL